MLLRFAAAVLGCLLFALPAAAADSCMTWEDGVRTAAVVPAPNSPIRQRVSRGSAPSRSLGLVLGGGAPLCHPAAEAMPSEAAAVVVDPVGPGGRDVALADRVGAIRRERMH